MVAQQGILPTGLSQALRAVVQNLGTIIFQKSQERVPVKTGRLKQSGNLTTGLSGGGFVIEYNTPYAQRIDTGGPAEKFSGDYVANIPAHKRRLPNKTITVRQHTKTYRNQRPVKLNGGWATLDSIPAFEGTGFLTDTFREEWQNVFTKHFPKTIRF